MCFNARVVPSLRVLPVDVRLQVLKILCSHVSEDDRDTLFKCVASLPDFPNATATEYDASSLYLREASDVCFVTLLFGVS